MKLTIYPDPILSERMPKFDFENPIYDPVQLEKDMIEFMLKNNGIGLAANQVGIRTSMFVMGHKDNPSLAKAFFNPIIVKHIDELHEIEEGCLSFPNMFVNVKRPKKILAKWQNSHSAWQESIIEGYDCRVFLHEYDHLEGIVFKDRISTLKWALALKKIKKRKNYGRT